MKKKLALFLAVILMLGNGMPVYADPAEMNQQQSSAVETGKLYTYQVPNSNIVLSYYITDDNEVDLASCNEYSKGDLIIPDSIDGRKVTKLNNSTFYGCDSLTSITLPATLNAIYYLSCEDENTEFLGTLLLGENIKRINVENGNPIFYSISGLLYKKQDGKNVLYKCPAGLDKTSVTIDSSVSSIRKQAFAYVENVKNVIVKAPITELYLYTFEDSSIESITLPATLEKINYHVFTYCDALKDIYFGGTEAQWKNITFTDHTNDDVISKATIHYGSAESNESGFTIRKDNFKFVNSKDYFVENGQEVGYELLPEDYKKLLLDAKTNVEKNKLYNAISGPWNGSCYGMSTVEALLYSDPVFADDFNFKSFWNASNVYKLPNPNKNIRIKSIINYYQLTNALPSFHDSGVKCYYETKSDYALALKGLITSIQDTTVPTVASIFMGSEQLNAHSILLLNLIDSKETSDYYTVKCCDPNEALNYTEMRIYKKSIAGRKFFSISYSGSANSDTAEGQYTNLYNYTKNLDEVNYYDYFGRNRDSSIPSYYYLTIQNTDATLTRKNEEITGLVIDNRIAADSKVYGPLTISEGKPIRQEFGIDKSYGDEYELHVTAGSSGSGQASLEFDDYSFDFSFTGTADISVNGKTGNVSVQPGKGGTCTVDITMNTTTGQRPWAHYEFKMSNDSVMTVTPSATDLVITSDDLDKLVVSVKNEIMLGENTSQDNIQSMTVGTNLKNLELKVNAGDSKKFDAYTDQDEDGSYETKIGTSEPVYGNPTFVRLAGDNRYGTASEVAQEAFPNGASSVLLVSGVNYPDALSASGYAGKKNIPILLTGRDSLPEQTKALIKKWNVSKVTIIGGTKSVTAKVENALTSQCGISSGNISRLAGKNRIETALAVENAGNFSSDACALASSLGFADALSLSPWCYAKKMPILLTKKEISQDVYMAAVNYKTVYIAGSSKTISLATENRLRAAGCNVIRLAGDNRYETSAVIAKEFAGGNVKLYNNTAIASGRNFPDALVGAALAGMKKSPIILIDGTRTTGAGFDFVKKNYTSSDSGVVNLYVLGGEPTVSNNALASLESYF